MHNGDGEMDHVGPIRTKLGASDSRGEEVKCDGERLKVKRQKG